MVASQSPTSFSRYPIRSSVELRVNTCTFPTSVSGEDELGFFGPHTSVRWKLDFQGKLPLSFDDSSQVGAAASCMGPISGWAQRARTWP